MKVVLQTVKSAHVDILGKTVGKISNGYLLLTGFTTGDDKEIVTKMADKIVKLRVFADEKRQINLSLDAVNGGILSISQFTLYADTTGGRRPSFVNALHPHEAEPLYEFFNEELARLSGKHIETGVFGADMEVHSVNDGPFTLVLDSKELF